MTLSLEGITRRYGDGTLALREVDLDLPTDGYVCIMGPSGSGKTTLLRIIAGLERPDDGTVVIDGKVLDAVPAERRPVHTVFQDHVLFPHLDVLDNVAFAARVAGRSRVDARREAAARLRDVGLGSDFGTRNPSTLSGGEAQRVALARALVERPAVVLLDEPLTALDRARRRDVRRMLHRTQRRSGTGFVHVTHDPEDALALADQLVILCDGRVRGAGAPAELYRRPPDLESARLLGELTPVPGSASAFLRPENLRPVPTASGARVSAEIVRVACLGASWEVELALGDQICFAHVATPPERGPCGLDWDRDEELTFDP